ncbi:MAG TPA: ArsR family transcriptional regulator [Gemmatimonadaceae bacterium]|nr:ArsR family transcriptional regulator [Gemmatimonadaceae bacterium]
MTTRTPRPNPPSGGNSAATRARLLRLLREGAWTVEDLATSLELTDNAVRFHLAALERDGTVRKEGTLRKPAVGQPATLYSLTPAAEDAFSRAYAPVLGATLAELRENMSTPQLTGFLKRVGRRLASGIGQSSAPIARRVADASALLNSLGGITVVQKSTDGYQIAGRACPLARAVQSDPCVCAAVTALVAEVVEADVRERCDRTGRPRCCFEITPRRVSS